MVGRRGLEPRPDRLRVCYASITPATQVSRHLRSNGLTAVDQEHWWVIQDLNLHSDGLKVRCVTITPITHKQDRL